LGRFEKANILDSDFYLADLFVDDKDTQTIGDDLSIRENLFVMFQNEGYKIAKENLKQMFDANITLKTKTSICIFGNATNDRHSKNFKIILLNDAIYWCRKTFVSEKVLFLPHEFG